MPANAEQAAVKGDLSTLYKITRTLSQMKSNQNKPVKYNEGHTFTKEEIRGNDLPNISRTFLTDPNHNRSRKHFTQHQPSIKS
ncbi:hypothetical protein DPMN_113083 [Dreissena polymorpha]|uniref:Uncharacterized protein n=1 Tax=Dreissena polymorpha TaxID=45954 RepID=A0A9D4KIE0_DREPO|nr:hypothetical protein DPMN_113083 [Dreissena polymorpha]